MKPINTPQTAPTDRLTRRESVAALGLSNMGEFNRLRIRVGTDDFSKPMSGTFDRAELLKLKNRLAPNNDAQPLSSVAPQQGRRIGMDRRKP